MGIAFNPDNPKRTHLIVDSGDAFPEKIAVSTYTEPSGMEGRGGNGNVVSGQTVFQGQRSNIGQVVARKGNPGFGMVVSFNGQGKKFGAANDDDGVAKVFFGTFDESGYHATCMKPVFGGADGQVGPALVALDERRFLLGYTKITQPMGNKFWGNDFGIDASTRATQGHMVVLDVNGQILGEPVNLPDNPIPVEVHHLEQGSQGITWISADPDDNTAVWLHRIKCQPELGGGVEEW
jgi:hypothetical protein